MTQKALPASWHVYMVCCADGSLYTGVTTDVPRRLAQHNAGSAGARYTRARRPVKLVWHEVAASRSAAQQREAAIKRFSREQKLRLLVGDNISQNQPDIAGTSAAFDGYGSSRK